MVIYILTKFGAYWLIFVDAGVYTKSDSAIFPNSRANNSRFSDSICPIIKLIRDFMAIYIVAKFGTDWLIFADDKTNMIKQSQIWQIFEFKGR